MNQSSKPSWQVAHILHRMAEASAAGCRCALRAVAGLLLLVGGCDEGDAGVRQYEVAAESREGTSQATPHDHAAHADGHDHSHDESPATGQSTVPATGQVAGSSAASTAPVRGEGAAASGAAADAAPVSWKLPEGWRVLPEAKPMRVATLEATNTAGRIEVALSRFPGDTGGLLANVNRWRQQMGLAAIAEADLATSLTPLSTTTLSGHTLRLSGERDHLLGAILFDAKANETWFVKATGSPAIIEAHAAGFGAFAGSLEAAAGR